MIRTMRSAEYQLAHRLQCLVYKPHFHEDVWKFYRTFNGFSQGCFLAEQEKKAAGYIISYPISDMLTEFSGGFRGRTGREKIFYLDDIGVLPEYRSRGLGTQMIERVFALANSMNMEFIHLVAVEGAESFWAQFGFAPV